MSGTRIWIQFENTESRERAAGLIRNRHLVNNNGSRGLDVDFISLPWILGDLLDDGFLFRVEVIS